MEQQKQKINARIVADSIDGRGNRITTFVLTYPRMIHAEVMTHRLFTRNAASSRAIPFKTMVKSVMDDPFIPIAWQKDHKGMQGTEYWTKKDILTPIPDKTFEIDAPTHFRNEWLAFRDNAVYDATEMHKTLGITKQLCNRLLEPFLWYTNLVTVTELDNFYELRCPKYVTNGRTFHSKKDALNYMEISPKTREHALTFSELDWIKTSTSGAEIHIQALAEAMWDAQYESKPNPLQHGEWHMPFMGNFDPKKLLELSGQEPEDFELVCRKIATARAARLSYMTFDGEIDYKKDIALHDILLNSKHMSPFEHCARVMTDKEFHLFIKGKTEEDESDNNKSIYGWCNNFVGFIQYRYLIENEG